jgi:hypothetical protein
VRCLGQDVEPEPDGDPDDRLARDRRGGIDPGSHLVERVARHDHVHVLEHRDEHQRADRHARAAQKPAQRMPRAGGPPEPSPLDHGQRARGDAERGDGSQIGAGHAQAGDDEQGADASRPKASRMMFSPTAL